MKILDTLTTQLPKLRTKIQLTGLVVLVAAFVAVRAIAPGELRAQIAAGALGVVFIVFGQLFHHLHLVPEKDRALVILASFFGFLLFGLGLMGFTVFSLIKPEVSYERLNELFGEDNWFVFPDHSDGVGVVRLREHFQVTEPVIYIDFAEARYKQGETVPGGEAATAKLTGSLDKTEYPPGQHKALIRWEASEKRTRRSWFKAPEYMYFDVEKLHERFGESGWGCDETFDHAIVVRQDRKFDVEYPFVAVDGPDKRKYGVGHTVPAGQSRIWLAGRLDAASCQELK